MAKHILSVSYDAVLLTTRQLMLEQEGYRVISALGLEDGVDKCNGGGFDLFILGHSIPVEDKVKLISTFRQRGHGPILSLLRAGEARMAEADYHTYPDNPAELLQTVADIFSTGSRRDGHSRRDGAKRHTRTA